MYRIAILGVYIPIITRFKKVEGKVRIQILNYFDIIYRKSISISLFSTCKNFKMKNKIFAYVEKNS